LPKRITQKYSGRREWKRNPNNFNQKKTKNFMSTYGGVVKEIPILSTPVAPGSTLIRGNVVEIVAGLAVVWAGVNPIYGICINDADNFLYVIDVYTGKGCSVQILCDTGIVPVPGALLYYSSATGVKVTGTAGTAIAKAVGPGLNGMVEAVLL
jgi:hypothetical protein